MGMGSLGGCSDSARFSYWSNFPKAKQVLRVERVKWILRRSNFKSFHGNLLFYGESHPEITCIHPCIQLQHELKQETIKSALEAGV